MQKVFGGGAKEWLLIIAALILFLTALILPVTLAFANELSQEEQQLMEACQSGDLIRLHVIANSDSAQDQAVKLHVRDALIDAFGGMLAEAAQKDCDAVYSILQSNIREMKETAQACARSYGFTGSVMAEVGVLPLPEKQYGQVTLPAGEYRALRITLGDGAGQNWWCVLFPQLCLALAETEQPSEESLYWSSERIFSQWLLMSQ